LDLGVPERIISKLLGTSQRAKIVDIGANVGQFAIPLAKDGHWVYSFEPVASTCETLQTNIREKHLEDRIQVTCAGLDQHKSIQHFGYIGDDPVESYSYKIVDPQTQRDAHIMSTVQAGPIDMYLSKNEMDNIHIFKTDTQGNELAVLRAAQTLLRQKNRPRFFLVEFSPSLLHSV